MGCVNDAFLAGTTQTPEPRRFVTNEEMTPMGEQPSTHQPVTYDRCAHVEAPPYHGTKSALGAGAELVPGCGSSFQQSRVPNNIYFTALVDTAAWAAELATALAGSGARGHIHVVGPIGPFEGDLNVTNKRFPGNPTQSYRMRHPLRVVAERESWQGHAPEVLKGMLDHLAKLMEQGLDVIEDEHGHGAYSARSNRSWGIPQGRFTNGRPPRNARPALLA
jgi:hypothetical protein